MGIIESRTGRVIRPNIKSTKMGIVEGLKVEQNEDGENTMKLEVRMLDL